MQKENVGSSGKEYLLLDTSDYNPSPKIDSLYPIDAEVPNGIDLEYDESEESIEKGLQSYDLSQGEPEDQ